MSSFILLLCFAIFCDKNRPENAFHEFEAFLLLKNFRFRDI
jgi:hypothetical protein